jgi:hypothetical protein
MGLELGMNFSGLWERPTPRVQPREVDDGWEDYDPFRRPSA